MVTEQERQEILDIEHLRLLPIFFWVLAGLDIFISLYGMIYVAMGAMMAFVPWEESAPDAPPVFMGWFFMAIGLGFIVWFAGGGVLKILAGIWMRRRTHRIAILVAAALGAMVSWPFGLVLAIFTFLVMMRPSVAILFDTPVPQVAPAPLAEQAPVAEEAEPEAAEPATD